MLLTGLEQQTYPITEVFIVDDGSPNEILDDLMEEVQKNFAHEFFQK